METKLNNQRESSQVNKLFADWLNWLATDMSMSQDKDQYM